MQIACPHCAELLPPVNDAFCSFCHGPLNEEPESADQPPSSRATRGIAGRSNELFGIGKRLVGFSEPRFEKLVRGAVFTGLALIVLTALLPFGKTRETLELVICMFALSTLLATYKKSAPGLFIHESGLKIRRRTERLFQYEEIVAASVVSQDQFGAGVISLTFADSSAFKTQEISDVKNALEEINDGITKKQLDSSLNAMPTPAWYFRAASLIVFTFATVASIGSGAFMLFSLFRTFFPTAEIHGLDFLGKAITFFGISIIGFYWSKRLTQQNPFTGMTTAFLIASVSLPFQHIAEHTTQNFFSRLLGNGINAMVVLAIAFGIYMAINVHCDWNKLRESANFRIGKNAT